MPSYNHKYVTEDISTHAKFLGKWYEKSEEPIKNISVHPVLRVNTIIVVHHLKLEGHFNVGNMKISLLMFINQHWKTTTFIDRDDAS